MLCTRAGPSWKLAAPAESQDATAVMNAGPTDPSAIPVPRLKGLLTLAWPIVISRASQVVVGVCDALMVAHLGDASLAATTTGAMNVFALLILPIGVAFIVSSFASQLFGKNDRAGARRYGYYGLALAVCAQAFCLSTSFGTGPLLNLLPYTPEVRELVGAYVRIRLLSGGAAVGIEALGNYYGGIGNTRLPMLINVLAMVLNVVGCFILIDGRFGAPAMGVQGSALAAALASTVAFAGLLARFLWDGRKTPPDARGLSLREFGRMLRFGLPSGLNWFFEFMAFLFFVNVVVAGLGTTELAAMMTVFQVNSVAFMPAFGLASAGAILVGQAIGAGHKDAVPRIVRLTFLTSALWQALVGITYISMPGLVLSAFARAGEAGAPLRDAGTPLLMLSAAWLLFDAGATTLAEALRAAGDTAFTLWARLVIAWVVFVPGSYLSVRRLGWSERGAVSWLVVYLALLAGVLLMRFRRGAWRRIDLTHTEPAA
jgi:MATE family multidrug resistance protein